MWTLRRADAPNGQCTVFSFVYPSRQASDAAGSTLHRPIVTWRHIGKDACGLKHLLLHNVGFKHCQLDLPHTTITEVVL